MKFKEIAEQEGLKVLFLHLGNPAGTFYRMIQPANSMIDVEGIVPIYPKLDYEASEEFMRDYEKTPSKYYDVLNKMFGVADIAVVSALHTTEFGCTLNALKKIHKIPILMECDDHPFEIGSHHAGFDVIGPGSSIEMDAFDQIKDSDAIICSTEYLKGQLSIHHKTIRVVPNSIDFDKWDFDKKDNGDKIIIGWSGASNHLVDLSLIQKPLNYLLDKYDNLEFHCVHGGSKLIDHPRFFHEPEWMSILDYPDMLASKGFDIGIAPLWDSEFNRCKSNLRYLELGALKVPCVASNVEPYKKTIEEKKDGLLCSSVLDWVEKLELLIKNKSLRNEIGHNAFKKVQKNYDSELIGKQYADILIELHDKLKVGDTDVDVSKSSDKSPELLWSK